MLFTRYKHRAGRECLLIHFFWDNEGNGRLEWTPTDIWKTFNLGIRSWHCSRVATGVILWERRVGIETNGLLGRESLSDGGRGSTWMKGEDVSSHEIARNCWRLRSAVANTIAWHAIDPEFNPRRSHFFTFCFFLHYSQYQLFLLFNNTNNWQTLWSIVSFYFNLVICHFSSNYSISVIKRSPILILCGRRTVTVLLFPNHQRETLSKCKEKASRRICNLWLSNQNGLRVPSSSKKKRIPV